MTPVELVREQFEFPFHLRKYQADEVNTLAPLPRAAYYWEPGAGKTAGSTHHALYLRTMFGVDRWIVLMPPILLDQWERWLTSILNLRTGRRITATIYRGTPKQRKALNFDADFTLMSYGIFKMDFERIYEAFEHRRVGLISDEATAIKNIESDTHKAVALFSEGRELLPLTGTPINKPGDAYAYIKLMAPGVYRNRRHFQKLHIGEVDENDKVVEWLNLDLLAENMKINTSRIVIRDVMTDLPPVIYSTIPYKLDDAHLALYNRIASERLVEFEGRSNIDAISASALRSALQQVVVNWGEFDANPERRPAVMDLIEETLDEIGDRKLVVAAHFRRSNRYLLEALAKYGFTAVYGDILPKEKSAAIKRFIEDPKCRGILVQPSSAGFGVDGLQHVCSDMIIVEAPTTPAPFHQVIKRLDRDGQQLPVRVRIAVAKSTVQVGMFRDLLENDQLANAVQGAYKNLKELVYGG